MCNGVKESRGQMKKYKLLKDLPTFKAGDIFYLTESKNLFHESDSVMAYNWAEIDRFPNILTDWFEEVKEPTRWKPEIDQKYYCMVDSGPVVDDYWNDVGIDHSRFEIGNCFKTEEEAKQVLEYLKALAVVRGDATTKFVKGKNNWCVFYSSASKCLNLESRFSSIENGVFGLPYFATREDARRSIKLHNKEWLTIFGIEEEK